VATAARLQPSIAIDPILCRPNLTACLIVCSDLAALLIAFSVSVYGRWIAGGDYTPGLYYRLWPVLGIFLLTYKLRGLYPGLGLDPVEELRRLITSTTMVSVVLATSIFLFRDAFVYSRVIFLSFWLFSIVLLPLARAALRRICGWRHWWGMPVVVLGEDHVTQQVVSSLRRRPELGLQPVAVLADDLRPGAVVEGVRVLGGWRCASTLAKQHKIPCAVVALSRLQDHPLSLQFGQYASVFPMVLVVANIAGLSTLWVEAFGLGQFVTLRVRHGLNMAGPRILKRALDIALSAILAVAILPVFVLVLLLVMLTSRGSALYGQIRVGRNGKNFKAWKFRTMVKGADSILLRYLAAHPEREAEWRRDHKLKHDPRVTSLGRFLRRTSIDELPQLWNVLAGEMSLVGPRPIVEAEIAKYGDQFPVYSRVPPGITGLWQVSGRNNTTYQERVEYDTYYVSNWSPWLDVYLLGRTVEAVVVKNGAY
jgi:Undecaprenyl-phosphate galactose phosphotransferase WbaP